jgi:hypothetical protein
MDTRWRLRAASLLILLMVLLPSACGDSVTGPREGRVRSGIWGGDAAGLMVTEAGAAANFTCGVGRIEQALRVDVRGRFDVTGVYFDAGGPVRENNPHPARFVGRADAKSLELTVQLLDSGRVLGPFSLSFGRTFYDACV